MHVPQIAGFASPCKRSSRTDTIHLDSRFFDHALTAKICLLRAKDQLNDLERDFLINVQYLRKPTDKQLAWLETIAPKARLEWRPT